MSLDQNLFTLNISPSTDNPNITDLVDPSGNPHYKKERVLGSVYKINVYDPVSESLLASATAPSATSKHKTLELHNPSIIVELKYTGTLSFKWRFNWEEHEFEWRREECFMLRKPDPAVLVAVTKEPAGRLKTSTVQILDYNINRFDIKDRKGLEIVMLTALLTFQDSNEAYHAPRSETTTSPAATPAAATTAVPNSVTALSGFFGASRQTYDRTPSAPAGSPEAGRSTLENTSAPVLPPRPAPKNGVERVAELHMILAAQGQAEANEVEVADEVGVNDYARYAEKLLQDDAMLFISIRSASAAQVPKVLQVVEQTKRLRHKSGIAEDVELHQYVIYDTAQPKKASRRINLNDPAGASPSKSYVPPTSLTVHLSKIDMPELRPRVESAVGRRPTSGGKTRVSPSGEPTVRERQKEEKGKESQGKGREKDSKDKKKESKDKKEKEGKGKQKANQDSSKRPEPNRLTRPSISTSKPSRSGSHSPPSRPPQPLPPPGTYYSNMGALRYSHSATARPTSFYATGPGGGFGYGSGQGGAQSGYSPSYLGF